ncbi:MAG: Radical domain protein [Actinomycetia bacterium]|nr:Radical domain protein [Actinomycetes bacterium]
MTGSLPLAVAHPPWPHGLLDVPALRAAGMTPTAFRQVVLKVHSRCNLACDYCYVYELADQGWRRQPPVMSPAIVELSIARIAEHVCAHELSSIAVVLHGGEPLLAGAAFIDDLAQRMRRALPAHARAHFTVQTNGTQLDRAMLDVLARNEIRVGVSIDGDQAANDRHRFLRNGTGSYDSVMRAIDLLRSPPYREVYGGLLCTVSLENDPVATFEALAGLEPPVIDLLLPHGTWSTPPPSRPPDESAPYADWLLRVFEHWAAAARPRPSVRLFEAIMALVLGEATVAETVGLAPAAMIVIDTDGTIKQVDALYTAYDGAADTGLHIAEHPLAAALDHPTTVARQIGRLALSPACEACRVRDVCGGGYYPHRYRAGEGFKNPSVFCSDLLTLITVIREYVAAEVGRLLR